VEITSLTTVKTCGLRTANKNIGKENTSVTTACSIRLDEQQKIGIELKSVTNGIVVISNKIKKVLSPMLLLQQTYDDMADVTLNHDSIIKKVTDTKVEKIPKCLAEAISGIKDNSQDTLSGVAESVLNKKINSDKNSPEKQIKEIIDYFDRIAPFIYRQEDKEIFNLIDKLVVYVDKVNYIKKVADYYDVTNCILDNCEHLIDSIVIDDFLWNKNDRNIPRVPLDLGSGKFKLFKVLYGICPEYKVKADIIETRYYKYIKRKEKILKEGKALVDANKDFKGQNPFDLVLKSIKSNTPIDILL